MKQMESAFAEKNRQTVAEGAVLLKNEYQMLPIREDDRVAVFGRAQLDYYRSGTGSGGSVQVEYTTNILDALIEQRTGVDTKLAASYRKWLDSNPKDDGGGGWAAEPWFQKDMELSDELVEKVRERNTKAIYVIGRTAGEDKDNSEQPGSYELTQQEKRNLLCITKQFEQVAVLLNVSNIIDLSWMDNPEYENHIQAVMIVWQGGMEGGKGTADVLTGRRTPSGKLPDTIPFHLSDSPAYENFGGKEYNIYVEDIYVGYRYYETFQKDAVRYPFGYGLSYTEFDIKTVDIDTNEIGWSLDISVQNTGKLFSGKEVVQVYVQAPQGVLGKPVRTLAAFAKTKILEPGETQQLHIDICLKDLASYDDSGKTGCKSCYVLEEGVYNLFVGKDVRTAKQVRNGSIKYAKTIVVEKLQEALAPKQQFQILRPGKYTAADGTYEKAYEEVSVETENLELRISKEIQQKRPALLANIDPQNRKEPIRLKDVLENRLSLEEFTANLTVQELAAIVRGEGMSNPKVTAGTASAFGGVSDSLEEKGIPMVCCADGPSGLRMAAKSIQLPIGTLLASTWNCELVQELYEYEGRQMREAKVDILLGPGANIHRHPLNGRNFEYYSEDPYLTGMMTTAVVSGLDSAGVAGSVKHMACNNQEAERFHVNSIVSERAIREIYLKAFQMAVASGRAKVIMTSYNPINGYWSASNYDLCTTILREEWGFDGIVMTDWWARMNDVVLQGEESTTKTRDMVRSGNDLYMVVNNNGAEINSGKDDTEEAVRLGYLTIGELQAAAMRILRFILSSPAILREPGENETVEQFQPLGQTEALDQQLGEEVIYLSENEGMITIHDKDSLYFYADCENDYTIVTKIRSMDTNLSQSTTRMDLNGKTAVVIQTNGTDGEWITQKLVKVHLKKGAYQLRLTSLQSGIEFDYILLKKKTP